MRKLKGLIIFLIFVMGVYFILINFTKPFVISKIEQSLARSCRIGALGFRLPLVFGVRDFALLNEKGFEKTKAIDVRALTVDISPQAFLKRKVLINRIDIDSPGIFMEINKSGELNLPVPIAPPAEKEKTSNIPEGFLGELRIKDGEFEFINKNLPQKHVIRIEDIDVKILDITFGADDVRTEFKISAGIITDRLSSPSSLRAEGWINTGAKDMLASFSLEDLDLTSFEPYYGNYMPKLKSGKLNIRCSHKAQNNNLVSDYSIEAKDLYFAEDTSGYGLALGVPTQTLVKYLRDSEGKLKLEFSVESSLDNPGQIWQNFIDALTQKAVKRVVEAGIQDLMRQLQEKVIGVPGEQGGDAQQEPSSGQGTTEEQIKKIFKGVFGE